MRIRVSVKDETLDKIRERVGPRGVPAYITGLVEREEKRLALIEWLEESADEHGEIPDEIIEEVKRQWPIARVVL